MKEKEHCTAIVLAAGSGSRMKSSVAKQYLLVGGRPLIWYALHAVEVSEIVDDCILVAAPGDTEYVRREIVDRYGFSKVKEIVSGGAERYLSVANGLEALPEETQYVFIQDGARPLLTEKILKDTYEAVRQHYACVAAVPSKDTVKIADEDDFAVTTPDRRRVWNMQTPQVFERKLIVGAYRKLKEQLPELQRKGIAVTDDAGVVELFTDRKVKLVEASYKNIKITTPEDVRTVEIFLGNEDFCG